MALEDKRTPGMKTYLESGGTDFSGLKAEDPNFTPPGETPAGGAAADDKTGAGAPGAGAGAAPAAGASNGATPAAGAAATAADPAPELGEEVIEDGKGKRKVVDKRALDEERRLRKEATTRATTLEADLQKERDIRARIDERLNLLTTALAPDPGAAGTGAAANGASTWKPGQPVVEDVFGAVEHVIGEIGKLRKAQEETVEQTRTREAQETTLRTFGNDAARFAGATPDFKPAYDHLFQTRKAQLELQGYPPDEVAKWLYVEEMNVINRAIEQKKSPAEALYGLAKTMGWDPAAFAAKQASAAAAAGNGAAAPAGAAKGPAAAGAPGAAAKPAGGLELALEAPAAGNGGAAAPARSVTEEISAIKAGSAAARSMAGAGGGGGAGLDLEWLSNLPPDEFNRIMMIPGNRDKVEQAMGRKG